MKYLLFGVFTFVLGIAFVGCGEDYDDDIKSLTNKDAALDAAIKDLETQVAKLASSGNTELAAAIEDIKKQIELLQNASSDPDSIAAILLTHENFKKLISDEIKKLAPELLTLDVVAGISAIDPSTGVPTTAPSVESYKNIPILFDYTFGEGSTAIKFTKGSSLDVLTKTVAVRVTPASATLDKSQILLTNPIGNKGGDINTYVKVKDVIPNYSPGEPATKAIIPNTGLYGIVLEFDLAAYLASDAAKKEFAEIVEKKFAIAIQTGERYVLTDFIYGFEYTAKTKFIHSTRGDVKLDFSVKTATSVAVTTVENISNKGTTNEKTWAVGADFDITKASNLLEATDDNRILKLSYPVKLNEKFTVTLTAPTGTDDGAYAYYVELDSKGATPTELASWTGIDGINTVVKTEKSKSITLTVTNSALEGKEVGLRLVAINADGTLVDPDGRAFYVKVGEGTTQGDDIKFTVLVKDRISNSTLEGDDPEVSDAIEVAPVAVSKAFKDAWAKGGSDDTPDRVKLLVTYKSSISGGKDFERDLIVENDGNVSGSGKISVAEDDISDGEELDKDFTFNNVNAAYHFVISELKPWELNDDVNEGKLELYKTGENTPYATFPVSITKKITDDLSTTAFGTSLPVVDQIIDPTFVTGTDGKVTGATIPVYAADNALFITKFYESINDDSGSSYSDALAPITDKVLAISLVNGSKSFVAKDNSGASVLIDSREQVATNPNYTLKIEYNLGTVLFGGKETKVTWTSSKTNVRFNIAKLYDYQIDDYKLDVTNNNVASVSAQLQRRFYGTSEEWANIGETELLDFYNPSTLDAKVLIRKIALIDAQTKVITPAGGNNIINILNGHISTYIGSNDTELELLDNAATITLDGGFDANGKLVIKTKALDKNNTEFTGGKLNEVIAAIGVYNAAITAGATDISSKPVAAIKISSHVQISLKDIYNGNPKLLYPAYSDNKPLEFLISL
ncbi:hypothetical protein EZS27_023152 [termite gut metagenome]|uniref:Uncharacterized protein n=1 Tax=termite gut metagenome TaxID=433724 RepID=A0A5J4R2W5_9ZZZZ